MNKVLSDKRLGAKLRVTENRYVLLYSLTYIYIYIYLYYGDLSLYRVFDSLYRVFDFMDYPLAVLFIINNYFSLVILYCMCHELQ